LRTSLPACQSHGAKGLDELGSPQAFSLQLDNPS
jgi:hypothetical protein